VPFLRRQHQEHQEIYGTEREEVLRAVRHGGVGAIGEVPICSDNRPEKRVSWPS
jgi:hypothetical protein